VLAEHILNEIGNEQKHSATERSVFVHECTYLLHNHESLHRIVVLVHLRHLILVVDCHYDGVAGGLGRGYAVVAGAVASGKSGTALKGFFGLE
jgi:hypothetical protein